MEFVQGDGVIYENGIAKIAGFIEVISSDKIVFTYGFNVYNGSNVNTSVTLQIDEETTIKAIEEDKDMYELLINKYTEYSFGKGGNPTQGDNVFETLLKERVLFEELFNNKPNKQLLLSKTILSLLEENDDVISETEIQNSLLDCLTLLTLHIDDCSYTLPDDLFKFRDKLSKFDVNTLIEIFLRLIYQNEYLGERDDISYMYSTILCISEKYNVSLMEEFERLVNRIYETSK